MGTQVIPTHKIGAEVIDLIRAARQRVVLVSPYWHLWGHLETALQQAAQRRVAVQAIFREDKTDEYRELTGQLHRLGARVGTIQLLHAKVYLSESACIVTSMNLLDFSAANSEELALHSTEPQLLREVTAYADGLLKRAKELKAPSGFKSMLKGAAIAASSAVGAVGAVMASFLPGKCIRCAKDIPFDPSHPMCESCFSSWSRYKKDDYPEKYCHACGNTKQTTKARPLCMACWKERN
jgi:phosphatidylserine/phosphatidylglycerophosphate/cardiolipin synthase-like enzyme